MFYNICEDIHGLLVSGKHVCFTGSDIVCFHLIKSKMHFVKKVVGVAAVAVGCRFEIWHGTEQGKPQVLNETWNARILSGWSLQQCMIWSPVAQHTIQLWLIGSWTVYCSSKLFHFRTSIIYDNICWHFFNFFRDIICGLKIWNLFSEMKRVISCSISYMFSGKRLLHIWYFCKSWQMYIFHIFN